MEKNNSLGFINEITLFIDTLRRKAKENGLEENIFIPSNDEKEKQIYEYVKERPQSAISNSTRPSTSMGLKSKEMGGLVGE